MFQIVKMCQIKAWVAKPEAEKKTVKYILWIWLLQLYI